MRRYIVDHAKVLFWNFNMDIGLDHDACNHLSDCNIAELSVESSVILMAKFMIMSLIFMIMVRPHC